MKVDLTPGKRAIGKNKVSLLFFKVYGAPQGHAMRAPSSNGKIIYSSVQGNLISGEGK